MTLFSVLLHLPMSLYAEGTRTLYPLEPLGWDCAPVSPVEEPMALVFADEFAGTTLDWSIWESTAYDDGLKQKTARGPDNLEVVNGELLLHIRKERRPVGKYHSEWTAGFVYIKEPVPNNVYIESRIRSSSSTGVNNAFWLAAMSDRGDGLQRNRYEIDIVEARREALNPGIGRAHLAWHDWKTYSYITNSKGVRDHVAQGFSIDHSWDDYHVWGLWYGENDFIFYFDGEEIWRGQTHKKYIDQWETGIGKFNTWFTNEQEQVYANFGQDSWRYYGGYAGDQLNIIYSTLPWGDKWTPLSETADGTHMTVDYIRVFRPLRLMNPEPLQHVLVDSTGDNPVVQLEQPFSLDGDVPVYMSLTLSGSKTESLVFLSTNSVCLGTVTLKPNGVLELALGGATARTELSGVLDDALLVVRITPNRDGTAPLLSVCLFDKNALPEEEPYLYHNADAMGNTSIRQGWHAVCKAPVDGYISAIKVHTAGNDSGEFCVGKSFLSVVHGVSKGSGFVKSNPDKNR